MSIKKDDNLFPFWIHKILKGICYWIAYKRILYTHYKENIQIPELAIQTEIWSILSYFRTGDNFSLSIIPEKPYKEILKENTKLSEEEIEDIFEKDGPNADIAIVTNLKDKKSKLSHVIEIKKYEGNNKKDNYSLIKNELDDLRKLKKATKNKINYYLIIFSQDVFPKRFLLGKEIVSKRLVSKKNKNNQNEFKAPIKKVSMKEIEESFGKLEAFDYFFVNKNRSIKSSKKIINKGKEEIIEEKTGIISGIVLKV